MSDVVESVDIEVNIVVSDTAKAAIDEINKELDKITLPGEQVDLGAKLDGELDKAKASAASFAEEMKKIREAGDAYLDKPFNFGTNRSRLDRQAKEEIEIKADMEKLKARKAFEENSAATWENDGGAMASIQEAGKAAEAVIDRLNEKVEEVHQTVSGIRESGDGIFSSWAESAKTKFGEIVESGRQSADLLRDIFGDNILSSFIDGAVTATEKSIEFGKNVQKLGESVTKWAPAAGQVLTKVGGAVAGIVPIVVGAAGMILGTVTAFAAAFALPITAVVAVVGSLGYAWYSAGQESKKALEEMAKADEKLKILGKRAISQRDRGIEAEGQKRSARTGFDIEDAISRAGVGDFEGAFEKLEQSLDRIAKKREKIASTISQEEKTIGSEVGRAAENLNLLENEQRAREAILQLTRQKFELEQQGLQVQRDKVKSQLDEVRAAQEVLQQQENSRLSLQERLGRLGAAGKLEEFEKKYEAFKTGGDLNAGIDAESILGDRIEGVGKAAAAAVESRFSTDFLDELGPKLEAKNQELLDKVSKAAGGLGQKAIDTLIKSLEQKDTDLAAAMQDAADKAAKEVEKLEEIIEVLMRKIRVASVKLQNLEYSVANSGGV